jgi:hypothetical protein
MARGDAVNQRHEHVGDLRARVARSAIAVVVVAK